MTVLESFKNMVRWHCWAHGKIPLFCTCLFYLVLKRSLFSVETIKEILIFLVFIILASIYGYLINDLFDMDIDKKQGKNNVFEKTGKVRGTIIVSVLFLISFYCGLYFKDKEHFNLFLFTLFFLATFYSAPPLRFKTRGLSGLLIVFITQYPIPVIMIFTVFESFGSFDMWAFALFSTITGAAQEIGHQRYDLQNDKSTGTQTYAVEKGEDTINNLYKVIIVFDMLSMFGVIVMLTIVLWSESFMLIPHIICIPLVIYLCLSGGVLLQMFRQKNKILDPYFEYGRNDIVNLTFTLFPNFFLPFFLACLLTALYLPYIIFAIIFFVITYITFPQAQPAAKIKILIDELKSLFKMN